MVSWFARLRALWRCRHVRLEVEGACQRSGNCCRNLILVDRGRPLKSLRRFRRLARRDDEFRMFVPHEEVPEDGLLRFRCLNLGNDQHCGIYERRPAFCREYPSAGMFEHGGSLLSGCGYRLARGASQSATFEAVLEHVLERPDATVATAAEAETTRSA